ncbi:MAG: hypothetical protein KatS3mg131_3312 [Candidatus Tectimicrobiota bacterium]|nr:MAG: hypothetical protein KatS3mg131_3312 [Candidatus Tectomicrobia bacterium]
MADVYVGKDLGTLELTITQEMVDHYLDGLEADHPWYRGPSPFGGPVAPALIFQEVSTRFQGWYLDNLVGNLWIRQEWALAAPVRVGQTLRCHARVADRYAKRGREVVVQEVTLTDEAGQPVAWGRHHQSFLPSDYQGEVSLRDPKHKEGARAFTPPAGEPLALELKKTFTEAMCNAFFYTGRNYHNDRDEARKLGFPDIVIGGRMTLACVSELLTHHFGRGWFLGGRLDVKFTNVLWVNEPFTTRGVITGRQTTARGSEAQVAVWSEKADGTKVLVGTASALEMT